MCSYWAKAKSHKKMGKCSNSSFRTSEGELISIFSKRKYLHIRFRLLLYLKTPQVKISASMNTPLRFKSLVLVLESGLLYVNWAASFSIFVRLSFNYEETNLSFEKSFSQKSARFFLRKNERRTELLSKLLWVNIFHLCFLGLLF